MPQVTRLVGTLPESARPGFLGGNVLRAFGLEAEPASVRPLFRMSAPDSDAIKSRELATWTAAAPGWRKHDDLISRGTSAASERLLDIAEVRAGTRLLDLASGTGEPALSGGAPRGPRGHRSRSDLTEEMLAFAREKAERDGLSNVEFRVCDAEQLDVEDGSYDAVTCRWGIMFMPDPVGALRRAHAALRRGDASRWPPGPNPSACPSPRCPCP